MKRPGFTLIELIIYVAITAMVVVALTNVMITILESREKTQDVGELQYGLWFSMSRMQESILNAKSVDRTHSHFVGSQGALTLIMADPRRTPTSFFLTNRRLMMQTGTGVALPLTPDSIEIRTLDFDLLSASGQRDKVHITIDALDPAAGTGSSAKLTLQTTVSLLWQ